MNIENVDLKSLQNHFCNKSDFELFNLPPGKEHYKLLANFAKNYDICYDIGSYKGYSALAMSYSAKRVISYDIEYKIQISDRPSNVEFRIGNFFDLKKFEDNSLILFDVDPHDGLIEKEFLTFIKDTKFKGHIIWDDIFLNKEMQCFWETLDVEKYDVTHLGHWSGTGISIHV